VLRERAVAAVPRERYMTRICHACFAPLPGAFLAWLIGTFQACFVHGRFVAGRNREPRHFPALRRALGQCGHRKRPNKRKFNTDLHPSRELDTFRLG